MYEMPEIGILNSTYLMSHAFGGQKYHWRCRLVWFLHSDVKEASVPVLSPWLGVMAVTLPYLVTVPSLYEGLCVHISHFYVDTGHFGLGGIIRTWFLQYKSCLHKHVLHVSYQGLVHHHKCIRERNSTQRRQEFWVQVGIAVEFSIVLKPIFFSQINAGMIFTRWYSYNFLILQTYKCRVLRESLTYIEFFDE